MCSKVTVRVPDITLRLKKGAPSLSFNLLPLCGIHRLFCQSVPTFLHNRRGMRKLAGGELASGRHHLEVFTKETGHPWRGFHLWTGRLPCAAHFDKPTCQAGPVRIESSEASSQIEGKWQYSSLTPFIPIMTFLS